MDEMTKNFKSQPDDFTEIHLIPYMHCDFSWTNSRKWHIWRYITGYKKALEIMRDDPEYTYVLDNAKTSAHTYFRGSGHMNFTDLPLFSPALASMLGTGDVDAQACIEQTNALVLAWFDEYLKDQGHSSIAESY